jgi:hypothetical protein
VTMWSSDIFPSAIPPSDKSPVSTRLKLDKSSYAKRIGLSRFAPFIAVGFIRWHP